MKAGPAERVGSPASDVPRSRPIPAVDGAPNVLVLASPGSMANLIHRYVAEQVDALSRRDTELRRGFDVVHPARVATRRLRSVLHVFGPYLDAKRTASLDDELRWYAGVMSVVRDREVLRAHLDERIAALPDESIVGPVAARIAALLSAESDAGEVALRAAMDSPRYAALMRELRRWRSAVPLAGDAALPDRPARVVTAARKKVRRRIAAAASAKDTPAALHRARKAAKRSRYVAELAAPAAGHKADKAIAWAKRVQDHLGRVQDSIVAAEFLRRAARVAESAGESTFTYGVLYEREMRAARKAARQARRKYL